MSNLPIFAAFCHLMAKAIASLHLPDSAITTEKLTYYTLFHPIQHLQHVLVKQESHSIKTALLKNPSNYATLEMADRQYS
eukprot:1493841-Ditylum_brightwellii.AAC.1